MATTRLLPTTLLVPDLPPKTFVGIDLISFTSTPNFYGIRDLPEGWHFLYTGASESFSLRCGAWFYVGRDVRSGADPEEEVTIIRRPQQNILQESAPGAEIRIWKWDHNTEALIPLDRENDSDRHEAVQHKANLRSLWQRGALFRYRSRVPTSSSGPGKQERDPNNECDVDDEEESEEVGRSDWIGLTDRLSPGLLIRVLGDPDIDVDGRPSWTVTSASTSFQDTDQIPGLTDKEFKDELAGGKEKELRFLPLDLKRTWPDGAIGRERTVAAQDRSWALGNFIEQLTGSAAGKDRAGEAQILGELQFTFLMVLTLMNYSCLQQWKRLLSLTLTCRAAIKSREGFFADVLRLLMLQLKHSTDVEGGLFELDNDDGAAFLIQLLSCFRRSLDEIQDGVGLTVKSQMEELETWVQKEFGWGIRREDMVRRGMLELEDGEQIEVQISGADEEDETGEYAPVVVDLGENGPALDDADIAENFG